MSFNNVSSKRKLIFGLYFLTKISQTHLESNIHEQPCKRDEYPCII